MVTVSSEDVEFLKDEYKTARKNQFKYQDNLEITESRIHYGIARGLELALVRMGVLNDELDKITQEAYKEVEG